MKRKCFGIFIALLVVHLAHADTIELKSGQVIEGKILERADDYIKFDNGLGIGTTYYLDEIASVVDTEAREAEQYLIKVEAILNGPENDKNQNREEKENEMKAALNKISLITAPESCRKYKELLLAMFNDYLNNIDAMQKHDENERLWDEFKKERNLAIEDYNKIEAVLKKVKESQDQNIPEREEALKIALKEITLLTPSKSFERYKEFFITAVNDYLNNIDAMNKHAENERLGGECDREYVRIIEKYNIDKGEEAKSGADDDHME